jgi:hypothetical protein
MNKILFSGYVNPTDNGSNFNLVLIKNNEYDVTKTFRYYRSIRTSGEVIVLCVRDNEVICTLL